MSESIFKVPLLGGIYQGVRPLWFGLPETAGLSPSTPKLSATEMRTLADLQSGSCLGRGFPARASS